MLKDKPIPYQTPNRKQSGFGLIEFSLTLFASASILVAGYYMMQGSQEVKSEDRKDNVYSDAISAIKGSMESQGQVPKPIASANVIEVPTMTCGYFPHMLASLEASKNKLTYCTASDLFDDVSPFNYDPDGVKSTYPTKFKTAVDSLNICLALGRSLKLRLAGSVIDQNSAILLYLPVNASTSSDKNSLSDYVKLSHYELFSYLDCHGRMSAMAAKAKSIRSYEDIRDIYKQAVKRAVQQQNDTYIKWALKTSSLVNNTWSSLNHGIDAVVTGIEVVLPIAIAIETTKTKDPFSLILSQGHLANILIKGPRSIMKALEALQKAVNDKLDIMENMANEIASAEEAITKAEASVTSVDEKLKQEVAELSAMHSKGVKQ